MRFEAAWLSEATSFVDVAAIVCERAARAFELERVVVMLHRVDAVPVVMVDNDAALADDARRALATAIVGHALFAAMLEHHAPAGTYMLPILAGNALAGSIRLDRRSPYPRELERELATMATRVAVRFAQLGIAPVPLGPAPEPLTAQQREVARLAARGQTNAEIAGLLNVSPNTVKKHLKDVFVRLDITNRTELANVLRGAHPIDVAPGVTRLPSGAVTRLR